MINFTCKYISRKHWIVNKHLKQMDACQKIRKNKIEPILYWVMLLVCISIQDENIGIFSHRVLYTKTWSSPKIFISFINFLDQKCANTTRPECVDSFYEWNIYWKILVTHEDLYSSKIFMNFGLKMCYWYLQTKMCQFFLWIIYILGLLEKILDIDRRY